MDLLEQLNKEYEALTLEERKEMMDEFKLWENCNMDGLEDDPWEESKEA